VIGVETTKLRMQGIQKEFAGIKALDGVNFELQHGEVHALLGINGAGKSTLIKILSGVYKKDAGLIQLDGKSIEINNPQDAINNGIATVYQDPQMIPSFTGYENIYLGTETEKKGLFPRINKRKIRKKAEALLERFPVNIDLTQPVSELSAVEKEIIAVLRALSKEMTVLILDEPTSILTETETEVLFRLIHVLKERNVAIIYITHRLEEIYQIADRLTILRNGNNVATLSTNDDETKNHLAVAELMIGKKLDKIYPEKSASVGNEFFTADNFALEGSFQNISFKLHRGEILGIFGLVGSGVEELGKSLFGVIPKTSGIIRMNGEELSINSASEAIHNGIFLVPGDRRHEGQINDEPIYFNVSLSNLKRISDATGLIQHKKEKRFVQELADQVQLAARSISQEVSLLSGGNQQKVVISKGLFTESQVYIFAEPTVGVDVGAKTGIYHLIRKLAEQGKAIIIISSDCEEVFGMCDQAMVLYKGRVTLQKSVHECRLEEMLLCGVTGGKTSE